MDFEISKRIKATKPNEWTVSEIKTYINGKHSKDSFDWFGDDLCQINSCFTELHSM